MAAFIPDLMDRSRLGGRAITFVSAPGDLAGTEADLYLVDLSRPGALEAIAALAERRVVGFGSHVDAEVLRAARAAGCDTVLARSAFFNRIDDILGAE
ncbi:MAG TPA: hypothetical protein VMY34_05900 [Acidimicrobiales bacterium]|nr:hypothetical protein [Acidimicrobiales bacterium]